jgi:hypothetical protein
MAYALTTRLPPHLLGVAYYWLSQVLLQSAVALSLVPLTLYSPGRHVDLVPFIAVRHLIECPAWRRVDLRRTKTTLWRCSCLVGLRVGQGVQGQEQ